jgi:hypothetical protein
MQKSLKKILGDEPMKSKDYGSRWMKGLFAMTMALALISWKHPTPVNAALEFNQWIPFTDDFDSCSGERVTFNGIQHILGRSVVDANGKPHYGFTRETHGTGFGQSSGDAYLLIDTVSRSEVDAQPGEPQTFMEQYHSVLLHKGETLPQDDTIIHFLTKLTVAPDGKLTASVTIQSVECQ